MKTKLAVLSLFLAAVCTAPLLAGFNEIAVSSYDFTPEPGAGWPEDPARTKLTDNVVPAAGENWSANKTTAGNCPSIRGRVTIDLGQSYEIKMVSLRTSARVRLPNGNHRDNGRSKCIRAHRQLHKALLDTTEKGESVTQDILLPHPADHQNGIHQRRRLPQGGRCFRKSSFSSSIRTRF